MIEIADRRPAMPPWRLLRKSSLRRQGSPLARAGRVSKNRIRLIDSHTCSHRRRLNVAAADENVLPAAVVEGGDVRAVACHRAAQRRYTRCRGHFAEAAV